LRREHRNRDEARISFRAQNRIGRERHFGYVKLAVVEHAPEGLARAQREECQLYAFGLHPSVNQRLGAIITATGEGQLELMHCAREPSHSALMFASLTIGHSAQCAMSTGNSALLRM